MTRHLLHAPRTLVVETRGAVFAEYVVLLGAVGLLVAAAIVGLGPTLLASFERARAIILTPMP